MSTAPAIAMKPMGMPRVVAVVASRPLWLALAVAVLVTALRLGGTVDSDVAWQLWIAGRIHAGARLYTDIVETNPPLWFWMALPVDSLASLLHVRIETVLIVTIGGLVAISLAATDRLIRTIDSNRRAVLLSYAALIMAAMPWVHVGQREQIVMIGAVPYAALIAARREKRSVSPFLAVAIGIAATLGLALKHYFLIVPVLLELWLLASDRWRPIRPETLAIVLVGSVYAAALIALERDYLTDIVPLLRLAYGTFGPPSMIYLFGPLAVIGLATLGVIAAHHRLIRTAPFAAALFVAAIGFGAAYFIQSKGWPYHAIPLVGCASLALAALLAESRDRAPVLRAVAPALLFLPFFVAGAEAWNQPMPTRDLKRATAGLRPGDTVGFLTEDTALPWSVTLQNHFRYPSRYNGYWMLSAVFADQHKPSPDERLQLLGRQVVSQTVTDFACLPPRRIIVARPTRGTWTENTADILPFFMRDPSFAELLKHYRPLGRTTLDVYELSEPFPPLTSPQCRRGA